jgi:hypothetical protein
MATSGHISAHNEQPVHCSGPENTATVNPILLGFSLILTSFFGQAMVQSPHPLQRVSSITIYDIDFHPLLMSLMFQYSLYQIENLRVKLPRIASVPTNKTGIPAQPKEYLLKTH